MVKGLEKCEEWMGSLGLFILEKKLRGGLITIYSFLIRGRGGAGTNPLTVMTVTGPKGKV